MTDDDAGGALLARLVAGLRPDGGGGEVVHRKSRRVVFRVEHEGRTCFAKLGHGAARGELRREARVHRSLADAGLPVANVVATGETDAGTWLVTAAAPGRPLRAVVDDALARGDARALRRCVLTAASAVAELVRAGYAWPDATADHVFVATDGTAGPRATLIDLARASSDGSRRASADTAAAFVFSLPALLDRTLVARTLRLVTGRRRDELRAVLPHVRRGLRRRALRTRWRHARAEALPEVVEALAALRGVEPAEVRGALYDHLTDARETMVVRTLSDRENRRFTSPATGAAYFVKRYPPAAGGITDAMRELRGAQVLGASGVPVCRVVAWGEDVERGGVVVVRGVAGTPLDDFLDAARLSPRERARLAGDLGRLYRTLRRAGLRHRDAYACHVFVERERATGDGRPRFSLRMIDLTRAGRAPPPRGRWFVKDVAQLLHGVGPERVSPRDTVRFLRAYLGARPLGAAGRRFARRVVAKQRRIAARSERVAKRRAAAGAPNGADARTAAREART